VTDKQNEMEETIEKLKTALREAKYKRFHFFSRILIESV
jgi:hypothetical protein